MKQILGFFVSTKNQKRYGWQLNRESLSVSTASTLFTELASKARFAILVLSSNKPAKLSAIAKQTDATLGVGYAYEGIRAHHLYPSSAVIDTIQLLSE